MEKCVSAALLCAVLPACAVISGCAARAQRPPAITGLRCEYLSSPLGIDIEKPRLSWIFAPDAPVRRQSAYRILVASSPAKLQANQGDLWDSGRVSSTDSSFVPFDGRPLPSRTRAWWKVRLWDDRQA